MEHTLRQNPSRKRVRMFKPVKNLTEAQSIRNLKAVQYDWSLDFKNPTMALLKIKIFEMYPGSTLFISVSLIKETIVNYKQFLFCIVYLTIS